MRKNKKNEKLHFDHLLLFLHEKSMSVTAPKKMDYFTLLEEVSDYYNLTSEELNNLGFRKAYRLVVEGV